VPRIPLIEELTTGPVPAGSSILVEYDPSSLWYDASVTIAAGWLRTGGKVAYNVSVQPPDEIRAQLTRLALKVEELEKEDKLSIVDHYTVSLGQKSKERSAPVSMKVADQSIQFMKNEGQLREAMPEFLGIRDDLSILDRFNQERSWVEFLLTRYIPIIKSLKMTAIRGLIRGIHSEWAYRQLEASNDGIVDFKLEEEGSKGSRNLMRVRRMRNIAHDREWHQLEVGQTLEITLGE
jgi:KaiC/GvpD/RAD55 family RecA-like ATPase